MHIYDKIPVKRPWPPVLKIIKNNKEMILFFWIKLINLSLESSTCLVLTGPDFFLFITHTRARPHTDIGNLHKTSVNVRRLHRTTRISW